MKNVFTLFSITLLLSLSVSGQTDFQPDFSLVGSGYNYQPAVNQLDVSFGFFYTGQTVTDTFGIGIYLSLDPTITTNDILVGGYEVPAFTPGGQIYNFPIQFTGLPYYELPLDNVPNLPGGSTVYVGVIMDYRNDIIETNENNNSLSFVTPFELPEGLSIEEELVESLQISSNEIHIRLLDAAPIKVEILSFQGAKLFEWETPFIQSIYTIPLNWATFPKSQIYCVRFSSQEKSFTKKLFNHFVK